MPVRPHAFVAMPFGMKLAPRDPADRNPDTKVELIDFNRVYAEYIAPALELAGFEPFRADHEVRAGDIIADMFQELLVADLVVADLTIDNPNVWYELGVRHALRARGVVIVSGGRVPMAFDLYTDRKLRYALKDGAPDPEHVGSDKQKLATMVRATMDAWHDRKVSPVYHLLDNLEEPEWRRLRIGSVREFWERHDKWEERIQLARASRRIGDLLVLANEAPIAAFRVDAWIAAGKALRRAGRPLFALEHLQHGLERDPKNPDLLREVGMCLQRLAIAREPGHSLDRARAHYRAALATHPKDPELWALLGRVDKDAWTAAWEAAAPADKRTEAAYEAALLRGAIESYTNAFRTDPSHYHSGINALTLMHLHRDLTADSRYDALMETMAGAVRFAATSESREDQIYWARATLGDLEVLVGTSPSVAATYLEAIAKNDKDWFALHSSRAQLQLLGDLGFRRDHIQAGIKVFDRALAKLPRPGGDWLPRQVLLFSGHMVDAPDREKPRFPADKEPIAAQRIGEELDALGAGPDDLALCQAAAGGDLLFLEACLQRGVRCQVLLPFLEPDFLTKSILPSAGGAGWRDRYFTTRERLERQEQGFDEKLRMDPVRIMPIELGPLSTGADPFERCNLWLLYTALSWGVGKTRFLCLWNGGGSDGPGGTEHMYKEVEARTGRVSWIDTRKEWTV
jgi:tetratricopeptide (TPR) repeat protein